ncbi:MAG: HU family DNA-binding protein [Oscillospiraceae bacterium]|nr:HU family DNA-binding protein [Oscillospiraceae bacterium]
MNKTELIAAAAEISGISKKDTEAVINATIESIVSALKADDKVQLVGFGSFEVKKRAARTGRNPKTKETIEIPASKVPAFKAGKALKDAVAK